MAPSARWIVFLVGLALSVALTLLFWPNFFFLALAFPFLIPLGRGRRRAEAPERRCPECGWTSRDAAENYCPRHGALLE